MQNQFIKDYLTFTKKERVALTVLLFLIFIVALLPTLWPAKKMIQPDKKELEELQAQLAKLSKTDTAAGKYAGQQEVAVEYNRVPFGNDAKNRPGLFYFDPNTLSAEGWKRLGLKEKTIQTIQHYLSKGGKFKRPEDVGRVYGLFKSDYERLLPYIKLEERNVYNRDTHTSAKHYTDSARFMIAKKKTISLKSIDINTADTAAFIGLPGIGNKLAGRIISFREKLGGFYAVVQLEEIFGLQDSTFQKIRPFLQCNNPPLHQLNINTADANTLKSHPYIRWNIANAIIQYRSQHGNFKSVDDLQLITIITPEIFQKIKPYLII